MLKLWYSSVSLSLKRAKTLLLTYRKDVDSLNIRSLTPYSEVMMAFHSLDNRLLAHTLLSSGDGVCGLYESLCARTEDWGILELGIGVCVW